MQRTVTKADLGEAVYRNVGLSRSESGKMVQSILDLMLDCIAEEEAVRISTFGVFRVRQKRERMGRNPKNGIPAVITSRKVLTFRSSPVLKRRTAQGGKSR